MIKFNKIFFYLMHNAPVQTEHPFPIQRNCIIELFILGKTNFLKESPLAYLYQNVREIEPKGVIL